MKVKVEQRHIDRGERGDAFCCAVALAVAEATGYDDVWVDEYSMSVGDFYYRTPKSASDFIENFDSGYAVAPFEFELVDEGP